MPGVRTNNERRADSRVKIALFSDIHANHPALRSALADAERRGTKRVFVAGDLVGDGPHPADVVHLLREREIPCIRGNVDRQVLQAAREEGKDHESSKDRNRAWTARQLEREALDWLDGLPAEREVEIAGAIFRIVHGSPLSDTDYIYPSITSRGLRSKLEGDAPDLLVCGHSHVPFTKRVAGVRVVNCGSVGRPADGDPRGSYALADLEDGRVRRSTIIRFPYPVDEVMQAMREREVPGVDPDEYRRGVKE